MVLILFRELALPELTMSWTVFYAWQSDRPNNTNRGLIQRSLEEAIKEVRADGDLLVDPRLDKDTLGVAGSPDIEATIFEKISQAAVFVADVTLVTPEGSDRPSPNPNVLVELGYAIRALGSERVIMVMNTAFGRPDDLPFDIRRKRTLTYRLPEDAPEKAPERKLLQKLLTETVRASLAVAERERPKVPAPPSLADQLIAAVEQNLPTQRSCARRYVDEAIQTLEGLRPPSGLPDDDALIAALEASRSVVSQFIRIARAVAVYERADAIESVLGLFEQLLRRYHQNSRIAGSFDKTDFDFFKFLGHEMFVVFVASFMEEQKWNALDSILQTSFLVTCTVREDKHATYQDLSEYTSVLDDVRKEKKRERDGTTRISIHADVLRERYAKGELAELVSWEHFCSADYFLYLRSAVGTGASPWNAWIPWSVIYLQDLPEFIQLAISTDRAKRLATGLGLAGVDELGERLKTATFKLKEFYRATFWRPPGQSFDWSKIASR